MSIYDAPVKTLHGAPASLADHTGEALLIVNVASKCGYTPQYAQLEDLQNRYHARGFSVLGFPCNQFGQQEPGTPEDIEAFCADNYGVTFPMYEKIDVNGPDRNPLYAELTERADAEGNGGDVKWNFEKFLVSPGGDVVARFRSKVAPDADVVIEAIEAQLPR
ncbi:MAG TPA: glutathione peroxidase [Candidatus Dormibacteraeota bacterium]